MTSGLPGSRRFETVAGDYARFRPGYPPALLDWILDTAGCGPGDAAADVGCGTGISARALAARGFRVTGIDPSPAMRERAGEAGGGPEYREGTAETTGLAPASVDLVVAAQSLHWFDRPRALAEFRRILRPGGWCAAFWNLRRRGVPFNDAYEALLRSRSREYVELFRGRTAMEELRADPGIVAASHREFDHGDLLDEEALLGRVRSASYVAHGVEDREGFEREIRALFRRHARGGRVAWAMVTEALLFRPGPASGIDVQARTVAG